MKLYTIKNWDAHFEIAQSRKKGSFSWVAIPVKHDGKGFKRLMTHPNAAALFGAWVLLVQIAAKCEARGVLADGDGPLSEEDFAIKTGCPEQLFSEMIQVLSGPKIGWILVAEWERAGSAVDHRTEPNKTDRTKQNPTEQKSAGGFFKELQASDLGNDAKLAAWHSRSVEGGKLPSGERAELQFWSAAEKARGASGVSNRVALFISIVQGSRWDLLTNESDERARVRLAKIKAKSNGFGDAPRGQPLEPDDTEERRQAGLKALGSLS